MLLHSLSTPFLDRAGTKPALDCNEVSRDNQNDNPHPNVDKLFGRIVARKEPGKQPI